MYIIYYRGLKSHQSEWNSVHLLIFPWHPGPHSSAPLSGGIGATHSQMTTVPQQKTTKHVESPPSSSRI